MVSKGDLFLSVLAMDSYNRGLKPTLNIQGQSIGGATAAGQASNEATSFSATKYIWINSGVTKNVISFRGTDNKSFKSDSDITNGWVIGAGYTLNNQAKLAVDAYKDFANVVDVFHSPGNVILTGHSLGGGLAGYISALSGAPAVIFDHMPFGSAALVTYVAEVVHRIAASEAASAVFNLSDSLVEDRVDELVTQILTRSGNLLTGIPYLASKFDAAANYISFPDLPNGEDVKSFYVFGEVLQGLREAVKDPLLGLASGNAVLAALGLLVGLGPQPATETVVAKPGSFGVLNIVERHSQALQVLLMYAEGVEGGEPEHTFWRANNLAADATLSALFSTDVGFAVGFRERGSGVGSTAVQLQHAIAYSVLEANSDSASGGSPGANGLLFGDMAAKVWLQDADDLGRAMSGGDNASLRSLAPGLAKVFTQYAGMLAVRGAKSDHGYANAHPEQGVLTVPTEVELSGKLLTVDLSDTKWSVEKLPVAASGIEDAGGKPGKIAGVEEMVHVLAGDPKTSEGFSNHRATGLWGAGYAEKIDRISIAIGDDPQAFTQTDRGQTYQPGKIALFASGDGDDNITGSQDDDLIAGGDGNDTLNGGAGVGQDLLSGGGGNDRLIGGGGNDLFVGGAGNDSVDYSAESPDQPLNLVLRGAGLGDDIGIELTGLSDGAAFTDHIYEVERIKLTDHDDIVTVASDYTPPSSQVTLDGWGGSDTLDLHSLNTGLYLSNQSFRPWGSDLILYGTLKYLNFDNLILTQHSDVFNDGQFRGRIDLGDGDDVLEKVGWGTEIVTGKGADIVKLSLGSTVLDLSAEDRVVGNGFDILGGLRNAAGESLYALGKGGLQYAFNLAGDLVVNFAGREDSAASFFLANWKSTQGHAGGGMFTGNGGITVAEFKISAFRLFENFQGAGTYWGTWELFGLITKVAIGKDYWTGKDPLVIDLDGDGFDLLPMSGQSPLFDTDADGYAERSAWVGSDDGFLVRDLNGDGQINDSREMFGGRGSGFELLATLDGDHNGVVNAADNGLADFDGDGVISAADQFSTIRIWNDRDGDGKVDQGEMKALSDFGVVGLSVTTTPSTEVVAGNAIAATATFVRADGTTGLVGEALLQLNNSETKYTGPQITVTTAAAAMPDLKGFGTLVSLRQALSVEAAGLPLVAQTLSDLNADTGHDLASIRATLRPLLKAWAEGSPIRLGDGNLVHGAAGVAQYANIPLVRKGNAIADYAWRVTDEVKTVDGVSKHVGVWEFATGLKVTMSVAAGVALPDLADTFATLGQPTGTTTTTVTIDDVTPISHPAKTRVLG